MVKVSKEFTFDSSHRLNNDHMSEDWNKLIFGKCNNEPSHGHTYKMIVTVEGEPNSDTGMVINFAKLKEIVNLVIIEEYDHKFLNNVISGVTTCENMVKIIYDKLSNHFPSPAIVEANLYSITLYETPTSWATYTKEDSK